MRRLLAILVAVLVVLGWLWSQLALPPRAGSEAATNLAARLTAAVRRFPPFFGGAAESGGDRPAEAGPEADSPAAPDGLPTRVDYRPYVTLIGQQGASGSCVSHATIHALNIKNEREHPYTPDLSVRYLLHRQAILAGDGPADTRDLLLEYGVCPETSLPSDFDLAAVDADGTLDLSALPPPTPAHDAAAQPYRVAEYSDHQAATVPALKAALAEYGPVIAGGPLPQIQGGRPEHHHVVAVVGYDDAAGEFTCLNSWGDRWDGDGMFTLAYGAVARNLTTFRYFAGPSADPTGTPRAYTARIRIDAGEAGRCRLVVRLGAIGEPPVTVWDTPNERVIADDSRYLSLDLPLPEYAAALWPPGPNRPWYLSVTNTGPDAQATVRLLEFTLARRYRDTAGAAATELYRAGEDPTPVPGGMTVRFAFPAGRGR